MQKLNANIFVAHPDDIIFNCVPLIRIYNVKNIFVFFTKFNTDDTSQIDSIRKLRTLLNIPITELKLKALEDDISHKLFEEEMISDVIITHTQYDFNKDHIKVYDFTKVVARSYLGKTKKFSTFYTPYSGKIPTEVNEFIKMEQSDIDLIERGLKLFPKDIREWRNFETLKRWFSFFGSYINSDFALPLYQEYNVLSS